MRKLLVIIGFLTLAGLVAAQFHPGQHPATAAQAASPASAPAPEAAAEPHLPALAQPAPLPVDTSAANTVRLSRHDAAAIKVAEAEARHYLTPCHEKTLERQALCQQNQSDFIEQYVFAMAGDGLAQGGMAATFNPVAARHEPLSSLGTPVSAIQACAWAAVRAAGPDTNSLVADAAASLCGRLSDGDQAAADRRVRAILYRLATAPVPMPPQDWEPALPPGAR